MRYITASDPKILESKEEKYVNLEIFEKKRRRIRGIHAKNHGHLN